MKHLILASIITGAFSITQAQMTMTFDTPPPTSSSQAPNVWYTDRFAPAGFTNEFFDGDNRLKISVSADDESTVRPGSFSSAFYNTQGRKFDTPDAVSLFGDIYASSDLATIDGRISGIWGTSVDENGVITNYPILELFNDASTSTFSIRYWDSSVAAFTPATIIAADEWVSLGLRLDGTDTVFSVNGSDIVSLDSNGTKSFSNLILNTYNADDQNGFDVYWDNVGYAPVPEPTTIAGLGLLATFGMLALRRRLKGRDKQN